MGSPKAELMPLMDINAAAAAADADGTAAAAAAAAAAATVSATVSAAAASSAAIGPLSMLAWENHCLVAAVTTLWWEASSDKHLHCFVPFDLVHKDLRPFERGPNWPQWRCLTARTRQMVKRSELETSASLRANYACPSL
mmetsp:Transcript_66113/g.143430  ORF Transcript_66113/g.143430 Transcript_66113/m.143430 type:complete len:140 (-) Transcript_66113:5-424(-)